MDWTTLYRLAPAGDTPALKVGTQWRFDREEVDKRVKGLRSGSAEIANEAGTCDENES